MTYLFLNCVALEKLGDNTLGGICRPSIRLCELALVGQTIQAGEQTNGQLDKEVLRNL